MNEKPTQKNRFSLGQLLSTPGALEALHPDDVQHALMRHLRSDWGDVGTKDWEENELSLREGFRLLSVYRDRAGVKFWIITEADRSSTTVLLLEEY